MNTLLLETLKKDFGAKLFDPFTNKLIWNGIDHSTKEWLEIDKGNERIYFEKQPNAESDEEHNMYDVLTVGDSIADLEDEYGWKNFPLQAVKDGRAFVFDSYDNPDEKIDRFIIEKYNLKSEQEIRELLETPVEHLDFGKSEIIHIRKLLKSEGINTLGDLISINPHEYLNDERFNFSETLVSDIIESIRKTGIDYGAEFAAEIQFQHETEYIETYKECISDSIIDPAEKIKLKELQEELKLSDDVVQKITKDYRELYNIEKPTEAVLLEPDNSKAAHDLMFEFNYNKFAIAEQMKDKNGNIPNLPEMSDEAASAVIDILDACEYSLYLDSYNSKFWIEDRQNNTFDEVDFPYILNKSRNITFEWANDNTIGEPRSTEREYYKLLNAFFPEDSILIPIDVRYQFELPANIATDYDNIGRNAIERIYGCINSAIKWPNELIKNDTKYVYNPEPNMQYDFTFRHYTNVDSDAEYSKLNYEAIADENKFYLEQLFKEEFGKDIVTFKSVTSSRPVEFHTDRNRLVQVDDWHIEFFKDSPEEYSKHLDLKTLAFVHSSVADEVRSFIEQKNEFLEILENNPVLKKFVDEKWQEIDSKNLAAKEQNQSQTEDKFGKSENPFSVPYVSNWEKIIEYVKEKNSNSELSFGEWENIKSVVYDVCEAIEENSTLLLKGSIFSIEEDKGIIKDYITENLFNRQWSENVPIVTNTNPYSLTADISEALSDVYNIKFPDSNEHFYIQPETSKKFKTFENIPQWAAQYMLFGVEVVDGLNLTDEDIKQVENFMKQENISSVIDVSNNTYFSSNPEFGLASDCVDINVSLNEPSIQRKSKSSSGLSYEDWNEMLDDNQKGEEIIEKLAQKEPEDYKPVTLLCYDNMPQAGMKTEAGFEAFVNSIRPKLEEQNPGNQFNLDKIFAQYHDSIVEAKKDKTEFLLCECFSKDGTSKYFKLFKVGYDEGNVARTVEEIKLSERAERSDAIKAICKEYLPFDIIKQKSDINTAIQTCIDKGFKITTSKNLNVTNHLLEIDCEKRKQMEEVLLQTYLEKVKEKCNLNYELENILCTSGNELKHFNKTEKEMLQRAFENHGLLNQKTLENFLKKKVNPPEHKFEHKRDIEIERSY